MSKVRLVIEIDEDIYLLCKSLPQGYLDETIANGTPITEDDLISREALKKAFKDCAGECACCVHNTNDFDYCGLIDNAPTVPLPNEQIAWEQGYEAGLAQGKHRPQGEWIDYSDDGFVECPFCGSCTTCEGNKDELHYCFSCGADMKGGADNGKS